MGSAIKKSIYIASKSRPSFTSMIRKLCPTDLDAFIRIRRESFQNAPLSFEQDGDTIFQPTVVMKQLEQTAHQFILGYFNEQAELCGIMGFNRYDVEKRKHRSYIWGVYLRESERGKGVAKQMLNIVLTEARAQEGLERIILNVSNHAKGAQKLYKSVGFVEFGREPSAARHGAINMDEIYMMLDL